MPSNLGLITDKEVTPRLRFEALGDAALLTTSDHSMDRPWQDHEWSYLTGLQIKEFGLLAGGWDSYHSPSISPTAIDVATQLLEGLSWLDDKPTAMPTPLSGVAFEWMGPRGSATITIDEDGDVQLAYFVDRGPEWSGDFGEQPDSLVELLEQIANQS